MSRCFPFPPPGYVRNGERSEALIESIKLQREIEKAKQDLKREKKEKKEKRRKEKKEKKERKRKEGTTTSLASEGKKLKHIDELKEIKTDGKLLKAEDCENEQFERSGITEEHDQPVSSREPCCLSDSTQTSSKRKRSSSPTSSQDNGTAFKIRLPLRKHREPEECKPDHVGSSSGSVGIADSSTKDSRGSKLHSQQEVCVTNAETNPFLGKSSDSRHCIAVQNLDHGDTLVTNNKPVDKLGRVASLYNSLFQDHHLTCEVFNSEDDQDWLFGSESVPKKVRSESDAFRCSTSSSWPRAQYLPDVDIYALPYTVPF